MKSLLDDKWFVPLALLLWTVAVMMFCDIDSYLYAQTAQFDSAVFYMCGKALVSGMTPYVEFADSKGVLLWLIYGIGYLIDSYSYVGVFWISCLFMWGTLGIAYKIARMWLDKKYSLLSACVMILPLVYWNFYFETKSESFAWLFVMWCIYTLLKNMVAGKSCTRDYAFVAASLVACLMMKWSIAVMMISLVLSIGWWSWKNKALMTFFAGLGSGLIVAILPFAIYFSVTGLWGDMIHEYFANTVASVSVPLNELMAVYAGEWLGVLTSRRVLYLLFALAYLMLWKKEEWFASALPFLCALCFLSISIRHDNFGYYTAIVGPFGIYAIVVLIQFLQKKTVKVRYITVVACLLTAYMVKGATKYRGNFCAQDGEMDQFAAISYAMSQVGNSTVVLIGEDRGLCIASTFPGTKYWMTQLGATEEMITAQDKAIQSGKADFVIYLWKSKERDYEKMIVDAGYHYLAESKDGVVYTKHDIQMPKEIKHFTVEDIITKKTYIEKYEED